MMSEQLIVRKIMSDWLCEHGYDGLVCIDFDCGCGIDDLWPCECPADSCCAAYRHTDGGYYTVKEESESNYDEIQKLSNLNELKDRAVLPTLSRLSDMLNARLERIKKVAIILERVIYYLMPCDPKTNTCVEPVRFVGGALGDALEVLAQRITDLGEVTESLEESVRKLGT